MSIRDDRLYLSGIVSMASFNMVPSYMIIRCYEVDNYLDAFLDDYGLKSNINLEEVDISFEDLMKSLLRLDYRGMDTFLYQISRKTGKALKVMTINDDKVLSKIEKYTTFYILEEVYIVEFENMIICFMIGNNE